MKIGIDGSLWKIAINHQSMLCEIGNSTTDRVDINSPMHVMAKHMDKFGVILDPGQNMLF